MHETLSDNLLQQIALAGYPTCMWVPTQCSQTPSWPELVSNGGGAPPCVVSYFKIQFFNVFTS